MFGITKLIKHFCPHGFWVGWLALVCLAGCASHPAAATSAQVQSLRAALLTLDATVSPAEAGQVARCAYDYPRVLASRYRVVRPALWHNFLVNSNVKPRGLCYQWAEDLLAQLQTIHLESLQLRWGIARANTVREHNCVVVTGRGQPFAQGIVLDAWRHSGNLSWSAVATDKYPWVEGELHGAPSSVSR